jgi:hypothetical protein
VPSEKKGRRKVLRCGKKAIHILELCNHKNPDFQRAARKAMKNLVRKKGVISQTHKLQQIYQHPSLQASHYREPSLKEGNCTASFYQQNKE